MSIPVPFSDRRQKNAARYAKTFQQNPALVRCYLCGSPTDPDSKFTHFVHVHGGGSLIVTEAEAAAMAMAADLGLQPIGVSCWRHHPELHPYDYVLPVPEIAPDSVEDEPDPVFPTYQFQQWRTRTYYEMVSPRPGYAPSRHHMISVLDRDETRALVIATVDAGPPDRAGLGDPEQIALAEYLAAVPTRLAELDAAKKRIAELESALLDARADLITIVAMQHNFAPATMGEAAAEAAEKILRVLNRD